MQITLVAAMANNRAIGKDNQLLWHLPADLQHFKKVTMGKPVMMGRLTYESIGKPLPGRTNIILTRNYSLAVEDCVVVTTVEQGIAVAEVQESMELIVIGGASFYSHMIPYADKLILTYVDIDVEGDVYFPDFDLSDWHEINREEHKADEQNPYDYAFVTYIKL